MPCENNEMQSNEQNSPRVPDVLFTVVLDEAIKIVRITTQGFWDKATAEQFCAQLRAVLQSCRDQFGSVRILSDARSLAVQSLDVNALLAENHPYKGGDKIAVVFDSLLATLAAKRNIVNISDPSIEWSVFSRVAEAEAWLKS
jgi:hypothetical protein